MTPHDLEHLQDALLEAVSELLRGTELGPPEDGLITDAVIICGYRQPTTGHAGQIIVDCCTPWASEGLIQYALRRIEDDPDEESEEEP